MGTSILKEKTPNQMASAPVGNAIRSGSGIEVILEMLNIDSVQSWKDDFDGDLIRDEWTVNSATTTAATAASLYTITSSQTAATYLYAVGNVGYTPNRGAMFQTRMKFRSSTSLVKVEMGFTSATASVGAVASLGDGDWAPTFTDTNCVAFVWDTNSNQENWCAVAAAPLKKVVTDTAPVADTFVTFGVRIDEATASFYIDGRRVAVIDSPTTAVTTTLAPYIGLSGRLEARIVDFDYVLALQSRNS